MKHTLICFAGAIILLFIIAGCQSQGNSNNISIADSDKQIIETYLNEEVMAPNFGGNIFSAHEVLQTDKYQEEIYVWALIMECFSTDDGLEKGTGMSVPMVLYFDQAEGDEIKVINHTIPRDGSYYQEDIKKLFPRNIQSKIFDYSSRHMNKLSEDLDSKVEEELEK